MIENSLETMKHYYSLSLTILKNYVKILSDLLLGPLHAVAPEVMKHVKCGNNDH